MAFDRSNIQTSVPLTEFSQKLAAAPSTYVADKIFPKKIVPRATGKVRVYTRDGRIEAVPDGRRGSAVEIEYKHSTRSYETKPFAVKGFLSNRDLREMDADLRMSAEMDLTEALVDKILLDREATLATKIFTAGNYAAACTGAGTAAWDNAGGVPIKDVNVAKAAVEEQTLGLTPNTLICTAGDFRKLTRNAEIVDRVKYAGVPFTQNIADNEATKRAIAQALGLDQILVMGAVKNSAVEDSSDTFTAARVQADGKAVVAYVNPNAALRSASFGFMLVPQGGDLMIDSWASDDPKGTFYRASHEYAFEFAGVNDVTNADCVTAYLLTGL